MTVSLKSNLVLSLPRLFGKSQQILVKPGNGLVEGLLLGPFLNLDRGVTANGETVLHARVLATSCISWMGTIHTDTPLNRLIW